MSRPDSYVPRRLPKLTSRGHEEALASGRVGLTDVTGPNWSSNRTFAMVSSLGWLYEAGGRLDKVCEDTNATVCNAPGRSTDFSYDGLARQTQAVDARTGQSSITTTTTYALDGQPATVAQAGTTMTFTYDTGSGLPNQVKIGSTVETAYDWNTDQTLHGRDDGGIGSDTVTFGYDWAKRLTTITPTSGTGFGTSNVSRTYRLDGLLASQSWPNGQTATLGYDTARRPTSIGLGSTGSLTRAYDRVGNVTTDDRSLTGVSGSAGSGALAHTYDALRRVTATTLSGGAQASYTYDRDGNRLTKTEGGQTYTATYDRTDSQIDQKIGAGSPVNLAYDSSGNLTTEVRASGSTRAYTYDAANRLTLIDDPTGNDAALAYDPLDRLRTRTVGSDVQTQSYVGTSDLAWKQAGTTTTTALVDSDGGRVGSKSGSTASWLVFDQLGSVAALEGTGSTTISDAFRYDAYGQTIGRYPSGGSAVPIRFRGLLDIAPTADPDVAGSGSDASYLMGARVYSPHLGQFTSIDSVIGEAIDPLTMNRFLYALANPATLIDPDGHDVQHPDGYNIYAGNTPNAPAPQQCTTPTGTVYQCGNPSPSNTSSNTGNPAKSNGTTHPGGTTPKKQQVPSSTPPKEVDNGPFGGLIGVGKGIVSATFDFGVGMVEGTVDLALCAVPSLDIGCSPKKLAEQFAMDPAGTAGALGESIRQGIVGLHDDLTSGDPERVAHAATSVALTVASIGTLRIPKTGVVKVAAAEEGASSLFGQISSKLGKIGEELGLGRSGACSFAAATLVRTTTGDTPISQIKVGDRVIASDEASGTTAAYPVTAVWSHPDDRTGTVVIDGEQLEVTPNHPFKTVDRGWVAAGDLQLGEQVVSLEGASGAVDAISWGDGPTQMWNLTVAVAHTYAVGDGGWLVHNACKPVPNPYGRKGGLAHQGVVDDVVSLVETRGMEAVREIRIDTPYGKRFGDVGGRDPVTKQVLEVHQVGRQTDIGRIPVARERRVFDQMTGAYTEPDYFWHPYN